MSIDNSIFEDLYKLSSPEMLPVLDTLFTRINESESKKSSTDYNLPNLSNFVEASIKDICASHFERWAKRSSQIVLTPKISLQTWEIYLSSLSSIFLFVKKFVPDDVGIFFEHDRIKINMRVSEGFADAVSSESVFPILRNFLREKILPITKMLSSKKEVSFEFIFFLDKSADFMAIPLNETMNLALNSKIMSFEVSEKKVRSMSAHLCLLVDENGKLMKFSSFPEHLNYSDKKRIFFLFPFLFRPISIIIELNGNIFPIEMTNLTRAGSVEFHEKKQDVCEKSHKFYQIDLFNFFFQ